MPVNGINHINIRTMDAEASAKFYVDIFGFKFRTAPAAMGNQSNWLFDTSGRPIIHLRVLEAESASTGPIDHIALDCDGQAEILGRLTARNIHFDVFNLQPGLTQVFVKDPHGVALELNFRAETAPQ